MALTAGTRLGPYEILSALGAGGMGEVYRARDAKLNRDVALKVLPASLAGDPDRLARFRREAQVLAALNHPNIAHIHGFEDSGATHALVMELVEGPTLAERIAQGPIPLAEALPIARQIADALESAHEQGIVHRDLKPANIKVRPDGTVKVLDFGLAKAMDPARGSDVNAMNSPTLSIHATQPGIILGTAAYMSPEQASGRAADKRSDLWAFGVVLLEMLTGHPVFPGETVSHVLAAVLRAEPDWSRLPADTPASVRRLLRRCLDKDRKHRLESASDARLEIEEASAGSSETPTATGAPSARRFSRRELAAWALAAALALVALMLGIGRFTATAPEISLTRFSIGPPEKSTFQSAGRGGWGSPISVSPDGRHIVFVVVASDGRQQLWIRALETTAMQPLAGTEGASSPFWSPDSRWVAFFADGKLKRIASGGGEAQVLCDSAPGAGGTWSRDDVILFSPASAGEGGLVRVPAGGGPPVPVTTLDKAHDETNHLWPQFLPDGRHYLYIVGGRDNSGLYVGSLDSTDRTRLLDIVRVSGAWSKVEYAAPGYLLFVHGRALLAQPFDATRLALTGEAVQVADGVMKEGPGSSAFSVSANGVLAFWSGAVPQDTRLTWMRRDGSAAGTVGPVGPYFELSLAPDDRTVAVSRFEPNEKIIQEAIWLLDVQRSTATKFTFDIGAMAPRWSRDGAHIAFASPRGGPPNLYQKSADNVGQDELVVKSPRTSVPSDWSPDGRTLVYEMSDPATKWDVWALPTSGARTPAPLLRTPFSETAARISPDGRWMAYVSDESGAFEVYVTTFPTPRGKWPVSTGGGTAPEWRRDGKELFYVGAPDKLMAVPVRVGSAGTGFEAGPPKMLFDLPRRPLGTQGIRSNPYAPAADGQSFLVRVPVNETTLPPATVVLNWPTGIRK